MSTSIRDIVLRARAAQNLSQGEMADAMGVSRVSVSNWETGKAEPSIASLQQRPDLVAMVAGALKLA